MMSQDFKELCNLHVCDLVAYEPGKPIEDTARELGLNPDDIVKLASNENNLGPSAKAVSAIQAKLADMHLYPDGGGYALREALASKLEVDFDQVILGNGSNEIIELLSHVFLNPQVNLVASEHAFVVYRLMGNLFGASYKQVANPDFKHDLPAMLEAIDDDTRIVFVANPNNPTGTQVTQAEIDAFMEALPEHVVAVFDEAYYEFLDEPVDVLKYVRQGRKVCVLRTFSKIYGLAALRIGYGIASKEVASILQKARQPFNTNALAQAAAIAALEDTEHVEATRAMNKAGLAYYEGIFDSIGLEYVPSLANFILVKIGEGEAGQELFEAMLKQGVIIRSMKSYGLPQWVRISVGTQEQNERCVEVLKNILNK